MGDTVSEHRLKDKGKRVFWEVVRVVIRETIRAARVVREIYTVKPESEEERLQREQRQEYARQRFIREGQERERRGHAREHWINRNTNQNTPQWLKDANKAVWDIALYYALGSIAVVVLLILFIISVNVG